MQPWQAFQKIYYESQLKSRFEEEWALYLEKVSDEKKTQFEFRNECMQKWFEEADPEVKKEVEEFRSRLKEESLKELDDNDERNEGYAKYVRMCSPLFYM